MIRIEKPTEKDLAALTALAKETFVQSHGHSASAEDIESYILTHYTEVIFRKEINQPNAVYYLLYYKNKLVGYSKINYNQPIVAVKAKKITKLERIYILEEFHGLGLGLVLFDYNLNLAEAKRQKGIWLYTWTGNDRAIRFYEKMGFEIVGSYDFRISDNHTNPNHQMYLAL